MNIIIKNVLPAVVKLELPPGQRKGSKDEL